MRLTRFVGLFAFISLVFGLTAPGIYAQTTTANFTLQPRGKATITYEAFCTNFGQKFPLAVKAPNAVAPDNLRAGLAYVQSQGLAADQNKALEAQYAIWKLVGATNSPAGGAGAQAVVSAANTAPAAVQGTSVVDAAKANQVKITLGSWNPLGSKVPLGGGTDNFYGRGQLTIENTSSQALTLYMPVGTLFPPSVAGEQTMAAYATNVQVNNPQVSQPTTNLPDTSGVETHNLFLVLALMLGGLAGLVHLVRMMKPQG